MSIFFKLKYITRLQLSHCFIKYELNTSKNKIYTFIKQVIWFLTKYLQLLFYIQ